MDRDYEEMLYYFEKPNTPVSDSMGKYTGSLIGSIIGSVLCLVAIVILRFDLLCSALLGILLAAFSYDHGNGWKINLAIFAGTFIVSLILQHIWIGFRIIYGIFGCFAVAILATTIIGYDSSAKMYLIAGVSFLITAVWGALSWIGIKD